MMTFKEAFNEMVLNGALVKRTTWLGYWKWENGTIMMYTKEGKIMDIRDTRDVSYTIRGMLKDDWEIATPENSPLLRNKKVSSECSEVSDDFNFIAGLGGSI